MTSYTIEQVSKHNTKGDCWLAVNGDVIDATEYQHQHPGGALAIHSFAGTDCSLEFNTIHLKDMMANEFQKYIIGKLSDGFTMDDVAQHASPSDCWIVVNGQVIDVTQYQHEHPGGALAIHAFGGTDCSLEFNTIHLKDTIAQVASKYVIGNMKVEKKPKKKASGGLSMDDVAQHTAKDDCWVVVNGFVLNVSDFLPEHPGGEAAIMQYAGKDASEEWNMIHQPEVLQQYGGKYIVGKLGDGGNASAGNGGITEDDVAAHNTKDDCWIIINGNVYNVTEWLPIHPGGEAAIMSYAGKDASDEWNMIHSPDIIETHGKKYLVGPMGSGSDSAGGPVLDEEEVAKHVTESDAWLIINEDVYNVTDWLPLHPGGVAAIMAYAGKDSSEQFNMIHPEGTLEKYGKKYFVGAIGSVPAGASISNDLNAPLLGKQMPDDHWWGEARNTAAEHGPFGASVQHSVYGWIMAVVHLVVMFMYEICMTIFTVKNFQVVHDKSGLTRAALFMVFFVTIHGLGNIHLFAGPDHFNAYGYFLNHPVAWGTLMLPVEIYLLVAGIMHVVVGTVRTLKFKKISMGVDQLWMFISGAFIFAFLVVHLSQFRFADETTAPMYRFRAKWMYPFHCATNDTTCDVVEFKDIYKMEFDLFENFGWVVFYCLGVYFFMSHLREGIRKVINSHSSIPRKQKNQVNTLGQFLACFVGCLYLSFPIFCYFFPITDWVAYEAAQPTLKSA